MASEWMPIETAPKDGTWFIAYRGPARVGSRDRVAVIKWDDTWGDFIWPEDIFDIYLDDIEEKNERGFYRHSTYQSSDWTHWMPLPPPPVQP